MTTKMEILEIWANAHPGTPCKKFKTKSGAIGVARQCNGYEWVYKIESDGSASMAKLVNGKVVAIARHHKADTLAITNKYLDMV